LLKRTAKSNEAYKNPDRDSRGPWQSVALSARNYYSKGIYAIQCPGGKVIEGPPSGRYWSVSFEKFCELDKENRIWWGKNRNGTPRLKLFLTETMQGKVPQTLWFFSEVGHTQEAKKELLQICDFKDSQSVFITPKPTRLLRRILEIATDKDSIVMDSFAGSGSTGHAVLASNKADGGTRKFILVEMDSDICSNITGQRLRRVSQGHKDIEPLGSGFRYCQLGEPLFNAEGLIGKEVIFTDLAHHVFFTATGEPLPKTTKHKSPLIGISKDVAVYLLYNGILKDKSANGGNVLTRELLSSLPGHDGQKIIYGNGCRIGAERLKRERIIFRQIPYQLRVD
jgi:site-specific DNA-methyltransferase (adenine-specific)/adenine-specific DNA-methyltransferase